MNGHENGNESSHNGSRAAVSSLEDRLITNFDDVLAEARDNREVRATLKEIKNNTNRNNDFGTDEKNQASFNNWVLYFRSLLILSQVGHLDNQNKYSRVLQEAMDYKLRLLNEIMMAYIPENDVANSLKYYEGVWWQVATFNLEGRKGLINAYKNPKLNFIIDPKKAAFWEQYNFTYK